MPKYFAFTVRVPDNITTIAELSEALEEIHHVQFIGDDEFADLQISLGESYSIRSKAAPIGEWRLLEGSPFKVNAETCMDCGRRADQPHAADCQVALAQDYEDGSIKEGDDSFESAKAAYERLTNQ